MTIDVNRERDAFLENEITLSILYDNMTYAMEEALQSNGGDEAVEQDPTLAKKMADAVMKLINEIKALIDRTITKLTNMLKRVMQSDDGFKGRVRKAMKENKPLNGIKLVAYEYSPTFLETQMNKVSDAIFGLISGLKTSYAEESKEGEELPMDMDAKDLDIYVFKNIGCPSNITNSNLYFEWLKEGYRKNKTEKLFTANDANSYYQITVEYDQIMRVIKGKQTLMNQQVTILQTNLKNITLNKQTQAWVKKRAMKQSKNASHLYNLYTTILSMYTDLRVERILMYRVVLKKLYHFS